MGTKVFFDKTEILDIQNTGFCSLYEEILKVFAFHELTFTKNIKTLVEDMELNCDGNYIDIAKYINDKKELQMFITLISKSIDEYFSNNKNISSWRVESLLNFKNKLDDIYKSYMESSDKSL